MKTITGVIPYPIVCIPFKIGFVCGEKIYAFIILKLISPWLYKEVLQKIKEERSALFASVSMMSVEERHLSLKLVHIIASKP